jgi:hypothetical protein
MCWEIAPSGSEMSVARGVLPYGQLVGQYGNDHGLLSGNHVTITYRALA